MSAACQASGGSTAASWRHEYRWSLKHGFNTAALECKISYLDRYSRGIGLHCEYY